MVNIEHKALLGRLDRLQNYVIKGEQKELLDIRERVRELIRQIDAHETAIKNITGDFYGRSSV